MSTFGFISPAVAGRDGVSAAVRGGTVVLRPLSAGDTATLERVFDSLSPRSRESRFMTPLPRMTSLMRKVLADVDDCAHIAWVAYIDGVPVGIARYVRTAPRTAEVAFEVADAHQGRGIGAVLLDAVTTAAAVNGVRRVEASVVPGNERSLRLLRQVGLQLHAEGGLLEGRSPLSLMPEPRVDRSAVAAIALRRGRATPTTSATSATAEAQFARAG
jgi:RimJ/RimL family protein N-acetyltransferase